MSAPINVFRSTTKELEVSSIEFVPLTTVPSDSTSLVYRAPANNTAIVLTAQVANTGNENLNVTFALVTGPDEVSPLVSRFPVAINDAADVLSGKLIVEEGQQLHAVLHNKLIFGQTQANYNDAGDNGTFVAGSDYAVSDVITLSSRDRIRVDAVNGSGAVQQFTVIGNTGTADAGDTFAQRTVSTNSTGTGFSIAPGTNNLVPDFGDTEIDSARITVSVLESRNA